MSSPGIVNITRYIEFDKKDENGKTVDYRGYIDYNKRKKAAESEEIKSLDDEFQKYLFGYLNDPRKTLDNRLFTSSTDYLDKDGRQQIKQCFQQAQRNKSPMWQDVISFNNSWLEKYGIYDAKEKNLDAAKVRDAIRVGVTEMLKKEKMFDSAVWVAAIHYNTDNIHVHIATVEPVPSRERFLSTIQRYKGKRKQSSIEAMKSKVANYMMDRGNEQQRMNDLIRKHMVHPKRAFQLSTFHQTKSLFIQALERMPESRRQWFYNYHSVDDARPYIDRMTEIYLKTFHTKEMKELDQRLDEELLVMKETYGENSRFERYKEDKKKDLYTRMGNAILEEMRAYDKQMRKAPEKRQPQIKNTPYKQTHYFSQLNHSIFLLHYRLRKKFHEYEKDRNLDEFDRMLEGRER